MIKMILICWNGSKPFNVPLKGFPPKILAEADYMRTNACWYHCYACWSRFCTGMHKQLCWQTKRERNVRSCAILLVASSVQTFLELQVEVDISAAPHPNLLNRLQAMEDWCIDKGLCKQQSGWIPFRPPSQIKFQHILNPTHWAKPLGNL